MEGGLEREFFQQQQGWACALGGLRAWPFQGGWFRGGMLGFARKLLFFWYLLLWRGVGSLFLVFLFSHFLFVFFF